jgi:MoaA/NifB/PqqE/SkfB family radical SAM enzyme
MKIINTAAGVLRARFLGHPFYVRFHLTHRCNYRCRMCGLRELADEERELETLQIEMVARRLAELGARHAVITGGEPFLRSDLPEVVSAFARNGFSVRIQTNGGPQVTRERLEACRDAGLRDISVSIDTMNGDLQDSICGVRGAAGNALRTLKLAATILPRGISQANIVASNFNFEELPALVRRFGNLGLYTYITPVMVGADDTEGGQELFFRSEDTDFRLDRIPSDVRGRVIDELIDLRRSGYRLTNSTKFLEDFRRYLETGKCEWTCEAGTLCLDVHPDGSICVCKEKPPIGSVLAEDFVDFYRSSGFRELAALFSEDCSGCFYGEYREPQYAVRDLSVFREWVGGWFRTYRRGMRLRHNGSGQDSVGIELAARDAGRDHLEDPSENPPAVKAG